MIDNDGSEIKAGGLIRHNFGIPPTTVDLFVFNNCEGVLQVIDHAGRQHELTEGIAESSYVIVEGGE